MKIDRLMAIVNLLTEYDSITAPALAERFEVSRRTINRDIEDLCMAGIPIVTRQGRNGGISIMDGYTLDKRLLKPEELSDILTGLKGLDSVSKTPQFKYLKERLRTTDNKQPVYEPIVIDLASHYKLSLSDKIEQIKISIKESRQISFDYYSPRGKALRCIEPYKVMYKWSDWYVLGFCHQRKAMRVFKLNRLWELRVLDEVFEPRELSQEDLNIGGHIQDDKPFEVLFDKSVEYMVVEHYGPGSYTYEGDKLHFHGSYTNEVFIMSWLLGFGNKARVIEPPDLIQKLKQNQMIF